jgi:Magnesium chelatase, subunit ChlI
MYLGGPGGTGKSQVIKAIATLFHKLDQRDMLHLTATTGVAANTIQGSTIDSVCWLRATVRLGLGYIV